MVSPYLTRAANKCGIKSNVEGADVLRKLRDSYAYQPTLIEDEPLHLPRYRERLLSDHGWHLIAAICGVALWAIALVLAIWSLGI